MKATRFFLLIFSVFGLTYPSFAQKGNEIPLAPANLKIDGKLDEFSDSLQNFDKSTHLYYAFAHDANDLYVFIQAKSQQDQAKIMAGGIDVSVNNRGKRKETATITFPVVDRTAMMAKMKNRRNSGQREGSTGQRTQRSPEEIQKMRTQMKVAALNSLRQIKVKGLKGISVEDVSIYNTYGIKTGIDYDNKGALVYELAIPFKLVGINLKTADEIAINIKVNGIQMPEGGSGYGGGGERRGGGFEGGERPGRGEGDFGGGRPDGRRDFSAMASSTDFWVKAKLAQ